ncbi:hypothetical protein [Scytonema sp. PRP1]|uniref:hypothetical protein n=1 Tax=Scytonema sp. PRP1 TaxID=3120513 RepID=UPI00300C6E11
MSRFTQVARNLLGENFGAILTSNGNGGRSPAARRSRLRSAQKGGNREHGN